MNTAHSIRSRTDFLRIPLEDRRSKHEKSLVKIVQTDSGNFLSEWSFDDIAREPYGVLSKRPMVYMLDAHEAIEKSMWCYEHAMVPLIGERDPEIASYTAGKYQIDQLISDPEACIALLPYLSSRSEPLESLSIIDSSFGKQRLMQFASCAKQVRLVLALPETGVLAEASLSEEPLFSVVSGCQGAVGDTFIVTKQPSLVTPIIEYDTALSVSARSRRTDGSMESFVFPE